MRQKRTIEDVRKDLSKSEARLKEVIEKGDSVISQYDLDFGYDAHFYLNCPDYGKGMLYAHVSYYEKELNKFIDEGKDLEQLSLI